MGFTIEKEKPRGDQARQTQKRRAAGKKRATARASTRKTNKDIEDAMKFLNSKKMNALQNFMGKTNYGGMSRKK